MSAPAVILSFDLEEHYRIEAAHGLECSPALKAEYARRMVVSTRQLLELLAEAKAQATFFIVGQIARTHPHLVRDIADAGHEIGAHSWDHERVHRHTPETFRDDLQQTKSILEDVSGASVVGFRAPTFSIVRETIWAIDVLAEMGFEYDSSIFPVRHDRYGIPDAPRTPFLVSGKTHSMLELPLTTWHKFGMNIPVAGGGYFRLFPLWVMKAGIKQTLALNPTSAMLYFHPWEFDADQPRLPLSRLSRWRTYVGTGSSLKRLSKLMAAFSFRRAIDVVRDLQLTSAKLPRFQPVLASVPADLCRT